jgi:hypothetical protein
MFDDSDRDEVHAYVRSLSHHLTPEVVGGLPVESLITHIHALNTERLLELRRCAEQDFRKWHKHWLTGQDAFRDSKMRGSELISLVEGPQWSVSEIRNHSARLFFHGAKRTRLSHALQYIDARYGGVISGIHGRVHHIARSFGGKLALSAYLNPHAHATLALWLLFLVDTGANCEVVRTTPWLCLQPSNDPGWKKLLLGTKLRSTGAHILDEFPERNPDGSLSLIEAIQMYQVMASRYHAVATPSAKHYLFVHEFHGSIDVLKEWTARSWFLAFLKRHPQLAQFDARPSMIRPSVLMSIQHRNDDHVEYAQAVGDHKSPSTTTQYYSGRVPMKLSYALKIRNFQNALQSVIIVSIPGATARLGLSDEQFREVFSNAKRSGLGIACLLEFTRSKRETDNTIQPGHIDECRGSSSMHWVLATVENVADLIQFKERFGESLNSLDHAQPSPLVEKWLPWVIFAEVALQKLRESECAAVYQAAIKLVAQRSARLEISLS